MWRPIVLLGKRTAAFIRLLKEKTRISPARSAIEPLENRTLLSGEIMVSSFMTFDATPTYDEPHIAVDAQGDFVVAWAGQTATTSGSPVQVFTQRYNSNGLPLGTTTPVGASGRSVGAPDVGMDPAGAYVVTWAGGVERFDSNGNSLGTATTGGAANEFNPADVGMDAQGDYTIDNDNNVQQYNSSGDAVGSPIGIGAESSLAMNSAGNFVITYWNTGGGIYARTYAANGTATSGPILVSQYSSAADQRFSSISINANGAFAVAWDDYGSTQPGVYAQLFTSNGIPVGSSVQVSTASTGYNPGIAVNSDGSFEVTGVGPAPNNALDVQEFSSSATPIGSPYVLTQPTETNAKSGLLAATPTGFDAVWGDYPTNSNGFGIGTGEIVAEQVSLPEPTSACLILVSAFLLLQKRPRSVSDRE